jgi:hypothetical protein
VKTGLRQTESGKKMGLEGKMGVIALFLLVCIRAIFGPQKKFARASLALIVGGVLFFFMMHEKSAAAAVMGLRISNWGFYLALFMVAVHFKWIFDCWLARRRNGRR